MRILVLSFYFEPDLSAGSFRTKAFVDALLERLNEDDEIDVITTSPNRYASYKIKASRFEKKGNLSIWRMDIPHHKSGLVDQAFSYMVFFLKTLLFAKARRYDLVFATSSRMFTGFLGACIARQKNAPLYLDLRDIFTDTMKSILGSSIMRFLLLPFFHVVESMTVHSATRINFVSQGFISYFEKKYKGKVDYSFFPNGIDEEFLEFSPVNNRPFGKRIKFIYTGNIGEGQGLEKIIPQIAEKYDFIDWLIIGDGMRKKELLEATLQLKNVEVINPVERKKLVEYYLDSDFLFLQLNDLEAFTRVLPSKIFEYAATYRGMVAGVKGYAREFLAKHVPDCILFNPCDIEDFSRAFNRRNGIDIKKREQFIQSFSRRKIMAQMADDVLAVARRLRPV